LPARLVSLFLAVVVSTLSLGDAAAQASRTSRPFSVITAEWNRILDNAEQYFRGPEQIRERTLEHQEAVLNVRAEAIEQKRRAEEELAKARQLLEALGSAPEEGEAPEPETVTDKRNQFAADISFYRARASQAELALTRATALEAVISASVRKRLFEQLAERTPQPWMPATLAVAAPEFIDGLETMGRSPLVWYRSLVADGQQQAFFYRFVLIILIAAGVGWAVRRWLLRRFPRDPEVADPSYGRRLMSAVAYALALGIIPAAILGALFYRVTGPDTVLSGLFADIIAALFLALFFFVLAMAAARAVLAPEVPSWTLTRLTPDGARLINHRVVFLAGVGAFDLFANLSTVSLEISSHLEALYSLVISSLEAGGILALVQGRLWRIEIEEPSKSGPPDVQAKNALEEGRAWAFARRLVGLLAIAAVAAIALGYGRLGSYLINNLLATGLVFAGLVLVRGLLRDVIGVAIRSQTVREVMGIRHGARERIKFWSRAALNPILIVIGFLVVAPFWGLSRAELARWSADVVQGFEIGGVTISIADIGLALVTFFVVMALTRLLQRSLAERVLPQTELDPGVRHSLAAGTGYVGLILAAALGIAVLGIDLTDVALIAGALSVGIGFGLQNVVNNFVSGLILLVERPIKVGDWVVVGANEGFVKRITVRATELETWQYASVIIPNAEILSSALINWTHKDRYGRIEVVVGVAYGSPTERVKEILMECAKAHPQVLAWPESSVLFRDFGASSLDFELRCYTGDVVKRLIIGSDLRYAIDQRFREEGIEIPFPQRVVHYAEVAPPREEATGEQGAPMPIRGGEA
jgi:small-conductance mechanosensitive channel